MENEVGVGVICPVHRSEVRDFEADVDGVDGVPFEFGEGSFYVGGNRVGEFGEFADGRG